MRPKKWPEYSLPDAKGRLLESRWQPAGLSVAASDAALAEYAMQRGRAAGAGIVPKMTQACAAGADCLGYNCEFGSCEQARAPNGNEVLEPYCFSKRRNKSFPCSTLELPPFEASRIRTDDTGICVAFWQLAPRETHDRTQTRRLDASPRCAVVLRCSASPWFWTTAHTGGVAPPHELPPSRTEHDSAGWFACAPKPPATGEFR